ncbi:unnamed protein product, partial [Cyprideis torosa]
MSTEIIFEERRLTELRVIDLKAELERRSLDKNGVKSQLMERLKEAMENEGLDPESHIFQVGKSGAGETPGKTKRSEADESVVSSVFCDLVLLNNRAHGDGGTK